MGMSGGGSKGGGINEINITPLVDVVLVLLIIFIVVAPQLQRGVAVKLPVIAKHRAEEKDKKDEEQYILVSIKKPEGEGKGGDVFIGKEQLTNREDFVKAMRAELQKTENAGKRILIRGDSDISYGEVRRLMEEFQELGKGGVLLSVKEDAKVKGEH